jgi:ABC-type branched-subunit amino acid transport system ATPase component
MCNTVYSFIFFERRKRPGLATGLLHQQFPRLISAAKVPAAGIRSGGKRAIVAIARTLLLRMRRMLLDEQADALPRAA